MTKEEKEKELTPEEVEEQHARELPDREELSVITHGAMGVPPMSPAPPGPTGT